MESPPVSPKKDLAIKQSILGVLSAKDRSGGGVLPISEFDKVVNAFGLTWDTPAVKNVLEHCKMEPGERLNFSALKGELEEEKKRLTARPATKGAFRSPAVIATPKKTGVLKEQQAYMKERQARAVQENCAQVTTVYKMLAKHDIDKNTAVSLLTQHNIYPTKELLKVASDMETGEVSFADFNRALTASDPFPRTNAILQAQTQAVCAGGARPAPMDKFVPEEVVPGKKLFEAPPSQVAIVPDNELEPEPVKFTRKMNEDARAKNCIIGALFNETGDSILGNPEQIDWSTSPSGRRHHIHADGTPDWARAQLNHGDCVAWSQQDQTELEARNAALARPSGRKVDERQLMANHLTNVISWDGFRGQDGLSEEDIIRRELSMVGGLSVASGQRNATSAKNILAWDDSPRRRPAGSRGSSSSSPAAGAALLNIGEYGRYTPPNALAGSATSSPEEMWAGSPSLRPERAQLRKSTSLSQMHSPSTPPFGTDDLIPEGTRSSGSFYGRGRTKSGARFGVDRNTGTSSPTVLAFAPGGRSPW